MQVIDLISKKDVTAGSLPIGEVVTFKGYGRYNERFVITGLKTNHGIQEAVEQTTGKNAEVYPGSVTPYNQEHGIGYYFPRAGREVVSHEEVERLKIVGQEYKNAEALKRKLASEAYKRNTNLSIDLFRAQLPADAKAVIVAEFHERENDPYADYTTTNITSVLVLGFSKSTRNNFNELRKAAINSSETAFLAESNSDQNFEDRYNFSLTKPGSFGWSISKKRIHNREGFYIQEVVSIDQFKLSASSPSKSQSKKVVDVDNISSSFQTNEAAEIFGDVSILTYSERAIVVTGNTKPIKDQLSALKGRYNPHLKHPATGEKLVGWIFPATRREEVIDMLKSL